MKREDWTPGIRVRHGSYGLGTVTRVTRRPIRIWVKWDETQYTSPVHPARVFNEIDHARLFKGGELMATQWCGDTSPHSSHTYNVGGETWTCPGHS